MQQTYEQLNGIKGHLNNVENINLEYQKKLFNQNELLIKEKKILEIFLQEIEESMLQMTEQYKELAEQTKERDRKIEHLNNLIKIKDEEIEQLKKEIEELQLNRIELNNIKLNNEQLNIDYENIKADRDGLQTQLNEFERIILQMTEQYKLLANQTYERDKKIEQLMLEIKTMESKIEEKTRAFEEEKLKVWWDKLLGN
ncbi:MAG: hypothetical protein BWY64_00891 [bacterium ADurb.Bin363]|nr:MAG: hypothetical protein BWY64_00891 [bacterium ADurb.Bin363]